MSSLAYWIKGRYVRVLPKWYCSAMGFAVKTQWNGCNKKYALEKEYNENNKMQMIKETCK